jgi:glycine/D-amino acid oxidase-like deaminating enzyme
VRRVCVVGAGIVGASVAFHLSRLSGISVTVVDAGSPGSAVTGAGTGWVTARGAKDAQYRKLRLLAMEEHLRLAASFPSSPWLTEGGTLQTDDASDDFAAVTEECREIDFPVEVLSTAEVNARLEPNIAFDRPDLRVAHFPTEFTVAGALLAQTLFDAAIDNGAIGHLGSRVADLRALPGKRHRVFLEDGTWLDVDAVVNAAGARADEVARFYDIAMPMQPQPGIGILIRTDGNPLRRMITVKDLAMKPETDGVIRLRSLLGWKTDKGPSEQDGNFTGGMERNEFVAQVVARAEQLLPASAPIRRITTKVGIRPIPADGFPRVGEVESVPGYFDAVMHSGGVLAPLIGRLLAEEIATGEPSPLLVEYRPTRFLRS